MVTATCPDCQGAGGISVVFADCDGQGQADECDHCHGTGVVPAIADTERGAA